MYHINCLGKFTKRMPICLSQSQSILRTINNNTLLPSNVIQLGKEIKQSSYLCSTKKTQVFLMVAHFHWTTVIYMFDLFLLQSTDLKISVESYKMPFLTQVKILSNFCNIFLCYSYKHLQLLRFYLCQVKYPQCLPTFSIRGDFQCLYDPSNSFWNHPQVFSVTLKYGANILRPGVFYSVQTIFNCTVGALQLGSTHVLI